MTLEQITTAAQVSKEISGLAEKNLAKLTEFCSGWSYKYHFVDATLSTDEVGQTVVNLLWADSALFEDCITIVESIPIERFMEICEAPVAEPTVTQLVQQVSTAKKKLLEALRKIDPSTDIELEVLSAKFKGNILEIYVEEEIYVPELLKNQLWSIPL